MEYEFEMDANDGTMLSWETDRAEADDIPLGQRYSEGNVITSGDIKG